MGQLQTLDVPVAGMDCLECTQHVQQAIAALPGVDSVHVFLASEKASIRFDPAVLDLSAVRQAVAGAGYSVPEAAPLTLPQAAAAGAADGRAATMAGALAGRGRAAGTLLVVLFGAVLFVVVVGEWLGLFASITRSVPWPLGWALVLAAGFPIFRNVVRATLRRQVISHTLMSLGVVAALAVGQWATAAVVVFFMRVGDYVEHFTTERARGAVRDLAALAPRLARVERDGVEIEGQAAEVRPGQIVVVRPGEQIPVDGEVIDGQASIDQAAITGEALPVESGPGARVYAATFVRLGHLRVRATHAGPDTTFGKVVRLVEEAEANQAGVQRFADRFSAWYLPVVAGLAALTLLLRRDPLAAAAVLVVACSCSVALATPIAVLASVGAAARRGLLIKGGKYLELLPRADVVLIDKTGTVTLGRPRITDIVALGPATATVAASERQGDAGAAALNAGGSTVLRLAASAERYSEHPLAEAVRSAARAHGLDLAVPEHFSASPGIGVQAVVEGHEVSVGSRRLLPDLDRQAAPAADVLEEQGKTLLFVTCDGELVGMLAAADTLRPEVPEALAELRALGVRRIELLTGDHEAAAAPLAAQLGIVYRAGLLPEDKIRIVKEYQAAGHVVVMIGDGINDAPALAQAHVGIAMAAAGSAIAIEAAHVAVLRDDWRLVVEAFRIARRTMTVVKMNLGLTAVYNVAGLSLAALGILPPILAAAAQSLPDLGILGNSARLLRHRK